MRNLKLLSTAAAVTILGASLAVAQTQSNEHKKEGASNPAAMQQNVPKNNARHQAQRKTPETTGQASPQGSERGTNLKQKKGSIAEKSHATDESRKVGATTGQASPNSKGEGRRDEKSEMNAKPGAKAGQQTQKKTQGETKERMGAGSNTRTEQGTTGQGAAAGAAKLSTEQRTKITSIIREHKVEPAHLNVAVRVGTRIPDSVHFYPLPVEVVDIYPEWRGYDYILVGDQILVINPRTHEIVAILEA